MSKYKDDRDDIKELTEKQKEALEQANHILSEQFDSVLVSVRAADDNLSDVIITDYNGAITDILGLAVVSVARIKNKVLSLNDEE